VKVTGTLVPRAPLVGLIEDKLGPVTVKVTELLVPDGVVTVTFRLLRPAPFVMLKVAVTWVPAPFADTALAVTPEPEMFTAVAPARPVPVRVTGNVVPLIPEVGLIEVRDAATTAKLTELLVPPAVVTVTLRVLRVAVLVIVKVAESCVPAPFTEMPLAVTPDPDTLTEVAPVRFVPFKVTDTVELRNPEVGLIEESVGLAGTTTVKAPVRAGLPPGVRTVTVLVVPVAVFEIVNVAVTVVEFATTLLTVTPVPETVTPVAPVKLVPLIVTGTEVPLDPEVGLIELTVGLPRTVKAEFRVVLPPVVVTTTFSDPVDAVAEIVRVAVSCEPSAL
jgi:hypothetical protein